MYETLQADDWQIGDSCTSLIETLPMLTRDDKKPEDGIKFEGDDALDATRYLLYSRHRAKKAPQDQRMDERIKAAEFTDPTSEMIWRRRWAAKDRQGMVPHFGRRGINRRKKANY